MSNQPVSIREINQQRILNLIRLQPGIWRAQIVKETDLGKATVSTIVSKFIDAGVVREVGTGEQRAPAGRRPVKLELNGQVRLAIGVELTGSECIATITDLHACPLRVVRYPMAESSVETSVELVVKAVDQLLDGYDRSRLIGLGVGVPGSVDVSRKRVIQAVNIGWLDVPLGPMLRERISKPVMVVKRQNAGAVGEHQHGIGKGKANLLFISVGVGIGCGVILRGELYEGTNGSPGEIGHITVVPDGYRCNCGNFGCLETLASCSAIAVRAREWAKEKPETRLTDWTHGVLQSITGAMVIEAASQGDPLAIAVIEEAASYLGIAVANVINLFNPAIVIVGGELMELGDTYLDPVREAVQRRTLPVPLGAVKIASSSLGDQAAAIGAATLVIDQFFALPNPFARELNEQSSSQSSE